MLTKYGSLYPPVRENGNTHFTRMNDNETHAIVVTFITNARQNLFLYDGFRKRDQCIGNVFSVCGKTIYFQVEASNLPMPQIRDTAWPTDVITECWDDVDHTVASINAGTVAPSAILKKLAAYCRQNRLDLALREVGRIERSLFLLDWLEDADLRRRCRAGLNKGEARHSLAQAIYTQRQGRITDRTLLNQSFRASGLNLMIAAIVYWNTIYMDRAVQHLRATGIPVPNQVLSHVAPLGWNHISLTGDYLWQQATEIPLDYWPLRLKDDIFAAAG
ncbi:hypothetical protein BSK43_029625 [Rhizobium sp. P44RR-XXIV]|nr:hypothetical protein BSK43_029625 [Rhizobium sp. P44RR-XXIV]